MGEAAREINYTTGTATDKYEDKHKALSAQFAPLLNTDYETFVFSQMKKREMESVDDFVFRLRTASVRCGTVVDGEIKKQTIIGCRLTRLRQHILETDGIALKDILVKARAGEASFTQTKAIEQASKMEITIISEPLAASRQNNGQQNEEILVDRETTQKNSHR